jgi:RNA polymerase sigma-70 factor (ECF subfamily)
MEKNPSSAEPRIFATTHWSVVLAVQDQDPSRAQAALEELCRAYWHPLYSYLRRHEYSPPDAEDLIQGFFEELLAMESLTRVAPERGRFRAFLLACLKKFVARQHQRSAQQKRGGGRRTFSLDIPNAEEHYGKLLGTEGDTPEQIYEHQWAATLLQSALDALQAEAVTRGQGEVFEHLQCTLAGESPSASYAELAARLGLTESAVKMVALRLRERFAVLFREEIARTVDRPEEVDEEIAHLFRVLAR